MSDRIRQKHDELTVEIEKLRAQRDELKAREDLLTPDRDILRGALELVGAFDEKPAPKSKPQPVVHSTVQTSRQIAPEPAKNGEVSLGVLPPGQMVFSSAEVATFLGVGEPRVATLRSQGKLDYKREPRTGCVHSRASLERLKAERDQKGTG